jgi:hypothetical protein
MKKPIALLLIATMFMSSCATILGGPVTTCQRTRPNKKAGEPARRIRPVALLADIVLGGVIFTGIDFITCAIYAPCETVHLSTHSDGKIHNGK